MTLAETKQLLITRIEEELREVNIDCEQGYEVGEQLNIPFMISPLYQVESNKLLFHILHDLQLHNNNYTLSYEKDITERYTYGKIIIQLEKNISEEAKQNMFHWQYQEDYTYELTFLYRNNCDDWEFPAININKMVQLGYYEFNGCEDDYIKFKDKYLGIIQEKKKQAQKEAKIRELKEQIEQCQNELKELENK